MEERTSEPAAREALRVANARRRAREVGRPATLTLREWLETLDHFGGMCAYCGVRRAETLDHLEPLSSGGATTAANCAPACRKCNARKDNISAKHWEERLFRQHNHRMRARVLAAMAYLKTR